MTDRYSEDFVIRDDVLLLYRAFDKKTVTVADNISTLAQAAFMGHSEIEELILPESITQILKFVFAECHGLKKITVGKNVRVLSDDAFDGCSGITEFIVDGENPYFKSVGGAIYSKDGRALLRVPPAYRGEEVFTIPEGVEVISTNAFNRVKGIRSIIIPDSVREIGNKAFCYCEDLKAIKIGANITSVGYCALSNIRSLEIIEVDEKNASYKVEGGALYTRDGKTLIQLPCNYKADSFTVGSNVEKIEDRAFSSHRYLAELRSDSLHFAAEDGVLFTSDMSTLLAFPTQKKAEFYRVPSGASEISGSAFQGCVGISEIYLGSSLKKIARHAFEGSSVSSVSGGESLSHIGWCSFSHCRNIKKMDLSKTELSYINGGAFSFCPALESIILPPTVYRIIRWAFMGCPALKSIEFIGDINRLLFDGASFFITEDEFGKIY